MALQRPKLATNTDANSSLPWRNFIVQVSSTTDNSSEFGFQHARPAQLCQGLFESQQNEFQGHSSLCVHPFGWSDTGHKEAIKRQQFGQNFELDQFMEVQQG
jgi:hypothetical protein